MSSIALERTATTEEQAITREILDRVPGEHLDNNRLRYVIPFECEAGNAQAEIRAKLYMGEGEGSCFQVIAHEAGQRVFDAEYSIRTDAPKPVPQIRCSLNRNGAWKGQFKVKSAEE